MIKGYIVIIGVVFCLCQNAFAVRPFDKSKLQAPPADLESFAYSIQDYMNSGDSLFLKESIGFNDLKLKLKLSDRAINQENYEEVFLNKVFPAMKTKLFSYLDGGYDWAYVNHKVYKKERFLTYHIDAGGSDEFLVLKMSPGKDEWSVSDWYFYSTDVWASESLSNTLSLFYRSQAASEVERNKMLSIFLIPSRPAEAISIFRSLPEYMKSSRFAQAIFLRSISSLSERDRIVNMEFIFPYTEEGSFSLLKTTFYSMKNDLPRMLENFRRLDDSVGGYVYLSLVESEILFDLGERKKGLKVLTKAIEQEESSFVYYTSLLVLSDAGLFDLSIQVLDVLGEDFDIHPEKSELEQFEEMSKFLQSDKYHVWASKRI